MDFPAFTKHFLVSNSSLLQTLRDTHRRLDFNAICRLRMSGKSTK